MPELDADSASSAQPLEPITATAALASLSEGERTAWQETGALPDRIQSPAAASTPALPVAQAASTDASSEPASAPAKTDKPKGVKARTAELDGEIKELQDRLKLRAQLREEVDRLDAKPAASSPATVPTVDPDAEPEPSTYEAGEYDPKFLRDATRWEARQAIKAERAHDAQQREMAALSQAQVRVTDAGRLAHDDFDAVLTAADASQVRFSPAMVDAIFREPNGHELAYVLAKDGALYQRIAGLPLPHQERELGKVLARLDSPDPAVKSALKTVTDTPDPPPTLGTRPAAAADVAESAVKRRDFAAYQREMNARDAVARG